MNAFGVRNGISYELFEYRKFALRVELYELLKEERVS